MKDGSKPELLSASDEQEASVAEHEIDALAMNMGGVVRGYFTHCHLHIIHTKLNRFCDFNEGLLFFLTVELSRFQSLRVSREQRRPSNVVQLQKQHQHSFQPNASSSMWRASHSECIYICFHRLRVDSFAPHLLTKQLRVMNTLCPRKNLFPTHEEIIRIRKCLSKKRLE